MRDKLKERGIENKDGKLTYRPSYLLCGSTECRRNEMKRSLNRRYLKPTLGSSNRCLLKRDFSLNCSS